MAEADAGPAFPIVFFDGVQEMDIGSVEINPALEYKPFQLMLSRKIGISPNQISIYLVDRKKVPALPFTDARRRIPITGKVNFGAICRLRDCCFLVVLKRSRKSRNRRDRVSVSGVVLSEFSPARNELSSPMVHPVRENLILLRREQQSPFYDQITQSELADLNNRLQSLMIQRQNYELAMGKGDVNYSRNFGFSNMNSFPDNDIDYFGGASTAKHDSNMYLPQCEVCTNENENRNATSFHHCVRDEVVFGYRSQLTPISRPKSNKTCSLN